jgi:type IV conjugative transfer system pilin TraA
MDFTYLNDRKEETTMRIIFSRSVQGMRRCFLHACIKFNGNRLFRLITGGILFSVLMTNIAHATSFDPSKDLLAADKVDISNNFGAGSTFMYIFYLVEIIAGAAAYIKTKNMMTLIGIIVVLIFTSVAFATIGS